MEKKVLFTPAQWFLIGIGLVVFVLLMFTDRTALETQKTQANNNLESQRGAPPAPQDGHAGGTSAPTALSLDLLAPFSEGASEMQKIAEQFKTAQTAQDSAAVYDRLTAAAVSFNRPDVAALHQAAYYQRVGGTGMLLKTATLHKKATELPAIRENANLAAAFEQAAIQYYEQYLTQKADDLDAQVELGTLLVHTPEPMRGIRKLLAVVEKKPNHFGANLELGKFSIQSQQLDKAEARLKTATEAQPNNWEAHFFLGILYERKNDALAAQKAYQTARSLTQDPGVLDLIQTQLKNLPNTK